MTTAEKLLSDIEAFIERSGVNATTFGEKATGDRSLLIRLRSGQDPRASTVDRCYRFMADWDSQKKALRASRKGERTAAA